MEKFPPSEDPFSELQAIVLDLLQNLSLQAVDNFTDISRSIDGIQITIQKITPALNELKQELAK